MSLYYYVTASSEEEQGLRRLESRSLFGDEGDGGLLLSSVRVDPGRSPFLKLRVEVMFEGVNLREIAEQAAGIELGGATFKVLAIDNEAIGENGKFDYDEKRKMEREIGSCMRGTAEMRKPDRTFGFARAGGKWLFGECAMGEAVWLTHNDKPRKYSTALSTRVARAVVNIAVPRAEGIRAIDPCCGIGTVLVEARSMGIDIVGREINPLAATGARENLTHFGYGETKVTLGDMREIGDRYDVAIIDMPYNLCSVLPDDEKLAMLGSARRVASRVVFVTVEDIDSAVAEAGFSIRDRCTVNKGKFVRSVLVCE
ncbi:TRM11 family SAM-dependent methyltransferase [Cohnella endophytica]|uniref:TRM11 family SAM-dependent methyltransferase n=1 Tax=Cohnella endophytica TaxID=2419778 RepID=UPI001F2989A3|nr:methyltransferase domain-containing protein [Cohnella endophytica]